MLVVMNYFEFCTLFMTNKVLYSTKVYVRSFLNKIYWPPVESQNLKNNFLNKYQLFVLNFNKFYSNVIVKT